jgi:hypothetical protein
MYSKQTTNTTIYYTIRIRSSQHYTIASGSIASIIHHLHNPVQPEPAFPESPKLLDAAATPRGCNALSANFIIGLLLGLAVNGAPNSPKAAFGYCGNAEDVIPPCTPAPAPTPPLAAEKLKLNGPGFALFAAFAPFAFDESFAGADKVDEMDNIEGPNSIPGGAGMLGPVLPCPLLGRRSGLEWADPGRDHAIVEMLPDFL